MKRLILSLFIIAYSVFGIAQQTISFVAPDNTKITGDLYEVNKNAPIIVLVHQANASRGEFKDIAPKLNQLGFTCFAIDLRSGNEANGIKNQTTLDAVSKGFPTELVYAEQDIIAAKDYIKTRFNKEQVILLGSSFSASLSLMIGAYGPDVKAVIAFSPGEYIEGLSVSTYIQYIQKPVFATGKKYEMTDIKNMMAGMNAKYLTTFTPSETGEHGATSLQPNTSNSSEYWKALTKFLEEVK